MEADPAQSPGCSISSAKVELSEVQVSLFSLRHPVQGQELTNGNTTQVMSPPTPGNDPIQVKRSGSLEHAALPWLS